MAVVEIVTGFLRDCATPCKLGQLQLGPCGAVNGIVQQHSDGLALIEIQRFSRLCLAGNAQKAENFTSTLAV